MQCLNVSLKNRVEWSTTRPCHIFGFVKTEINLTTHLNDPRLPLGGARDVHHFAIGIEGQVEAFLALNAMK